MLNPELCADAIADIESNDNPRAFGDSGLALTSYQVHPSWLWEWAHKFNMSPFVAESWDSFVRRVVVGFFRWFSYQPPVDTAMHFHKGHAVEPVTPDWDVEYGNRFLAALAKRVGS